MLGIGPHSSFVVFYAFVGENNVHHLIENIRAVKQYFSNRALIAF